MEAKADETTNIPKQFEPNVHSNWHVLIAEDVTDVEKNRLYALGGLICAGRQLLGQHNVKRVNEGTNSVNYIVTDRFADGEERVVYRRAHLASLGELERTSLLTMHVRKQGVRVPRVYEIGSGSDRYTLEDAGELWQRFEYIPGDHFKGECEELGAAALEIARLHKALSSFVGEPNESPSVTLEVTEWNAWLSSLSTSRVTQLIKHASLLEQARTVHEQLQNIGNTTRKQFIHTDLHPHAFLFENGKPTIIDFGNASYGALGMDVGMALHRLVRQCVIYAEADVLSSDVRLFLDTYLKENPAFADQVEFLPLFIREILLRKVAFNIHAHVLGKRSEEMACSEINKFIGMLHEVDTIAAHI